MSHVDSDLEEGEILDDSPSSYDIPNATKSHKKLPRRYVLHENKSTHKGKHKKNCKHSNPSIIRYHARKLSKLKKVSPKMKDSHKCCSHKNVYIPGGTLNHDSKPIVKHVCQKNGHTHHNYSLTEKKSPLRQHNVYRHGSKAEKFLSEIEYMTNCTFSEMLSLRKSMQSQRNRADFVEHSNEICETSVESCDVMIIPNSDCQRKILNSMSPKSPEVISLISPEPISPKSPEAEAISPKSPEVDSGESEDEEELRRIALATCAKRVADTKQLQENSNNGSETINSYVAPESSINNPVPESSVNFPHTSYHENSNEASDNYEVIDMDLDEVQSTVESPENDNLFVLQSTFESPENDNLFVIDTEPQVNCEKNLQENSAQQLPVIAYGSDEDLKMDILRVELVAEMIKKRNALENQMLKEKSNLANIKAALHSNKKNSAVERPENKNSYPDKPVEKPESSNSSKRLVISLKEDSSSEESGDDDDEPCQSSENPVAASIDALISDIRQKSDTSEKKDELNVISGALACLSKSQQQEYNSLVKILAKKKEMPSKNQDKNNGIHSPLNALKSFEKKLLAVRESLKKKRDLMSSLSKESDKKRYMYLKSKIAAANLREKYIAAEKVRRMKLQAWSKSHRNYETVEKSVSSLESKITQLQNLCSKMGATLQGQNYNLPTRKEPSR